MKIKLIIPFALAAIYISSCTVMGTLYPFTEDPGKQIIRNELIGKWSQPQDSSLYYVIDTTGNDEGRLYKIDVIELTDSVADTTSFRGYFIEMNGWHFLDCWYYLKKDQKDFVIERHFPVSVSFTAPDKLEFSVPDPEELLKLINQHKLKLTYAKQHVSPAPDDYSYLILDKSQVLQQALIETKKYPILYKTKIKLIRSN